MVAAQFRIRSLKNNFQRGSSSTKTRTRTKIECHWQAQNGKSPLAEDQDQYDVTERCIQEITYNEQERDTIEVARRKGTPYLQRSGSK